MNKNLILWISLIILTLSSYLFSESRLVGVSLSIALMLVTIVKFSGVGFQFMELKKAHKAWQIALVLVLATFVILISVAYS